MEQPQPESQLIDLREFFRVLRRRKWVVLIACIVVVGVALGVVYLRTPLYTSRAEVEVQPSTTDEQLQDINMETEATRVTQEQVAALAAPALGVNAGSARQLERVANDVVVSVPPNTTYLNIDCTATAAAQAQACARAFSDAYVEERVARAQDRYDAELAGISAEIKLANRQLRSLEALPADTGADRREIRRRIDRQNQIILAAQALAFAIPSPSPTAAVASRSADLPEVPSNKPFVLAAALGLLLGGVVGVGLAFILERMDVCVGDRAGMEAALGAPVLATVPLVRDRRRKREPTLITRDEPRSQAAEAYRTARPTLLYLAQQDSVKVVAVTGAGDEEGKSTATANLAASLAIAGETVVAVSCDLRKPRLHTFFERDNEKGLSDVLNGTLPWKDVLQETDIDRLTLIASGPVPPNPAELLGAESMTVLLDDLRQEFDLILLDTPPALIVGDTVTLIPKTDRVLVVADGAKTPRAAVMHLRQQFERVGGHNMGGILFNPARGKADDYPSYSRSYYSSSSETR